MVISSRKKSCPLRLVQLLAGVVASCRCPRKNLALPGSISRGTPPFLVAHNQLKEKDNFITKMSDFIDWLHSPRGVCKIDLYSPEEQQEQKRKVIRFIDVSTLNVEGESSVDAGGSDLGGDLALKNLEEREIIVIKDPEKQDQSKTEGSICLIKQAPCDTISILNCLLNDLQKYALGFQHALSPSASNCKHKIEDAEKQCHKLLNIEYMASRPQSLCLEKIAAQSTNNSQVPSTPPPNSPSAQRATISPEGECCMNDVSFYVYQVSNLVDEMAPKEIKEKLEKGQECFYHSVFSHSGDKGKSSPHAAVNTIASEMVRDVVETTSAGMQGAGEKGKEGGQKTVLYRKLSNKSKARDKHSKDAADSISERLTLYANQVAPDLMVSVMKTLKVNTPGKPIPPCVTLKRVLLKHTQEIVSDLIDSCMKNLHNITGALMTDCDFVSAVKRSLFCQGKQTAADIMKAMLKRLVSTVLAEDKETKSQNLFYASMTAGSHDLKGKNQSLKFSTMKGETKREDRCQTKPNPCKSLTSAERVGQRLLEESLTMWRQSQGKPGKLAVDACAHQEEKREKVNPFTDFLAKELIVSALGLIQYHLVEQAKCNDTLEKDHLGSTRGYVTQAAQYKNCASGQSAKALLMKHLESRGAAGPSPSQKETHQADRQKLDMSNIILSLIEKLLGEGTLNCDELSEGENTRSEPKSNKATSLSKREQEHCEDSPELDFASGMRQMNRQLVDQLTESVIKLCLLMAKYSKPGAALAEVENNAAVGTNPNYQLGGPGCSHNGEMSQNYQGASGADVIVNNQCSTNSSQKQLQAVLQWMAASQCNVPVLYFMQDDEGQLEKLPQVSAKAVEKGYSVGDLLREVMKFAKEQQEGAGGGTTGPQLLDWLLSNL